jgi:hypothetical protein
MMTLCTGGTGVNEMRKQAEKEEELFDEEFWYYWNLADSQAR